jgi:hypothetical protein
MVNSAKLSKISQAGGIITLGSARQNSGPCNAATPATPPSAQARTRPDCTSRLPRILRRRQIRASPRRCVRRDRQRGSTFAKSSWVPSRHSVCTRCAASAAAAGSSSSCRSWCGARRARRSAQSRSDDRSGSLTASLERRAADATRRIPRPGVHAVTVRCGLARPAHSSCFSRNAMSRPMPL